MGYSIPQETKKCCGCKQIKPGTEFSTDRRKRLYAYCRPCACLKAKKTRDRMKAAGTMTAFYRRNDLKRKYGLTPEQYDDILSKQNGVCAVCKGLPEGRGNYHVDHCHETGKIRGLLCHYCNLALGMVKDEPALLRKLAYYLEVHRGV